MSLPNLKTMEAWFVTGSQHLYGDETLKQVASHSQAIAKALDNAKQIPVKIVFKPTVKTPEEIYALCQEANTRTNCIGIIAWIAYFFSCQDVDRWFKDFAKTFASFTHAIQP